MGGASFDGPLNALDSNASPCVSHIRRPTFARSVRRPIERHRETRIATTERCSRISFLCTWICMCIAVSLSLHLPAHWSPGLVGEASRIVCDVRLFLQIS